MYLTGSFHLAAIRSCLPTNYKNIVCVQEYDKPWIMANDKLNIVVLPNCAFYYGASDTDCFDPTNFLFRYADTINKTYGAVGIVLFVPEAVAATIPFLKAEYERVCAMNGKMPGIMTNPIAANLEQYKLKSPHLHHKQNQQNVGLYGQAKQQQQQQQQQQQHYSCSYPVTEKTCLPFFHFAKSPPTTASSSSSSSSGFGKRLLTEKQKANMINNSITPYETFTTERLKHLLPSINLLNETHIHTWPRIQSYALAYELSPFCNKTDCSLFALSSHLTCIDKFQNWPNILPILQIMMERDVGLKACLDIHWNDWLFYSFELREWLYAQDGFEKIVMSWLDKKPENASYYYDVGLRFPAFVTRLVDLLNAGQVTDDIVRILPFDVLQKACAKHYGVEMIAEIAQKTLFYDGKAKHTSMERVKWVFGHPKLAAFINKAVLENNSLIRDMLTKWTCDLDVVKFAIEKGVEPRLFLFAGIHVENASVKDYLLKHYTAYANIF